MLQTLETNLAQTNGYNPMVGAVTSKILLNVLSDNGLHQTALKTATMTTAPSWGFWWARNSSTCWESWPLKDGHGSGTLNHIFLCGGVGEWMWKHLVGLTPAAPQFAEVTIHPKVHPTEGPASVRQLRHCFGPSLTHRSRSMPPYPTRVTYSAWCPCDADRCNVQSEVNS